MALTSFYYPSLIWPGGRIDFDEAYRLNIPPEQAIGSVAIAASGVQETLVDRLEVTVSIIFWPITTSRLTEVRNFWRSWGCYGKPSELILDRLNTCVGQYEYDHYNLYFSKAVLINNPFAPTRQEAAISRSRYLIPLSFRQDGG